MRLGEEGEKPQKIPMDTMYLYSLNIYDALIYTNGTSFVSAT